MGREQNEVQKFIRSVRPSARYFYRAAYAITADRQMAEYVLGSALIDAYLRGGSPGGSLGFRDSVLAVIREKALRELAHEKSENDWDGLCADPEGGDRLNALLVRESLETQRMMTLRFGCAMTVKEIAGVMKLPVDQVRDELNRCQLHIERILSNEKLPCRPFDRLAMRSIRRAMNRERDDQIDVSYILHSFETELAGRRRPRRILMKIVKWTLFALIAFMCAAMAWLVAVLLEM